MASIRFKSSIDVEGDRLTAPLARQVVYANILAMDRYLRGIMRVIFGKVEPAAAIAEIEA